MRKTELMKRLLLLIAVFSLLLAVMPATMAQEGEGGEAETEAVEEEGHSEEAAAAEEDHGEEAAAAEGGHGEAAEEEGLLTPLGINSGLMFVQTFNFLLIAFLLTFLMWKPAVNMLDARAEKIQKGIEDASEAAKARQNAEQEAQKILADARAEASKIIDEARGRGDEVAQQIESGARSEAEKIRTDARADAESARDTELAGLRDQVLNISMAVAQRLIGENLDKNKQQAIVDDFFSKVPAEAKALSGSVEVVSAMPLTDAEQNKAKSELGADDVTFSVDPSILGGLIVRAGDRVVDGSVRSGLADLSSRLN